MWKMSVIIKSDVILLQSKAKVSLELITNYSPYDQLAIFGKRLNLTSETRR